MLREVPLLNILGINADTLRAFENAGMAPLRFITTRGPFQDGETVLDMRFDPRVIQILVAERLCEHIDKWDRRADLLSYLRPNRSFGISFDPLVLRRWLPAGKVERGTGLQITSGSNVVTCLSARFVDRGGLRPGDAFEITYGFEAGVYRIVSVPNDYTLVLDHTFLLDDVAHYAYRRGHALRDLHVTLEQGPKFDEGLDPEPAYPHGYREVLRFIAHDPFWYGAEQSQSWVITEATGDLIFDGQGAWFAVNPGDNGRWLFASNYVGHLTHVVYWGTVGAKPVITIEGPAENPVIENKTIGTHIALNYNVGAGEVVTIDTLNLTVTNNTGSNLLPFMSGDIATFQLSPPPQAPPVDRRLEGGVNEITITFGGASLSSRARMTWRNRYVGI